MTLADFVEAQRDPIIERWKSLAVSQLSLEMEESQLINDLPVFVEGLVTALRDEPNQWLAFEGAEKHGRHRAGVGENIAGLIDEMMLVAETILELAGEQELAFPSADLKCLMRVTGRAAAVSARAYAGLRDKQLAAETARHFSFIAHEIRNPLSNARLAAEVLGLAPEGEKPRYLERLKHALERLSEQVDNALIDARLYGKPELARQWISASALVDTAFADVAASAEQLGLAIRCDVEDFHLHVDSKLLVSALTNLLSNAVKFSCKGGRITISAHVRGDFARFEIEDQCGGLPDGVPEQLFQPFVQKDHNRSGFGLGLSIVQQAVEAHQGTVSVENHPGKGCCFRFEVPLSEQATSPQ